MNETRFVLFSFILEHSFHEQKGLASHPSIIALAYSGKESRTLLPLLRYAQPRCSMA
jgi:hypothetical protein